VPVADRIAGCDKQVGFRYYLNRPYLVVKEPILVMERKSLVRVDISPLAPKSEGAKVLAPNSIMEGRVTFLDGPRSGQGVLLSELQMENPGSGEFRQVTPTELETIQDRIRSAAGLPNDPTMVACHRSSVSPPGPPTVIIQNELPQSDAGFIAAVSQGAQAGAALVALSDTAEAALTMPDKIATSDPTVLKGVMEIIYLPDLDEQYVIKSTNILAKSAFGLAFKNGTELVEVQGEHDSTTVAISLLGLIQGAISAAAGVEEQRLSQQSKSVHSGPGAAKLALADLGANASAGSPIWQVVERVSIKPGVYRLNKPWEIEGGPELQPCGCGLLAKLGLPTVTEIVDFRQVGTIGGKTN
jgi:hypothetical protein